jgi:hypothetical protein
VKCDNKQPCENCVKREHPQLCSYKPNRSATGKSMASHSDSSTSRKRASSFSDAQDGSRKVERQDSWPRTIGTLARTSRTLSPKSFEDTDDASQVALRSRILLEIVILVRTVYRHCCGSNRRLLTKMPELIFAKTCVPYSVWTTRPRFLSCQASIYVFWHRTYHENSLRTEK